MLMRKVFFKNLYRIILAILCMVLFIALVPSDMAFGGVGNGVTSEDHSAYDAPTTAITGTVSRWKDRPFSYSKSSKKARVRFYDETGTALTPFYYSTEGIAKGRFDAEDNGAALVAELGKIVTVTGGQTLNAYLSTGKKVYYVLQRRYHLEMSQEARYVYFVNDTTRFIDITEGPVKSDNGHDIYTLHANDSDHTKLGEVYLVGTSVYDAKTDERKGSTGSTGKWQFRSTTSTNTYGLGFGGNGPSLPAGCDKIVQFLLSVAEMWV